MGSLLSYGLAQIEGTTLDSYQWIFIMSGVIAFVFAIPTMLILPSHPTTAKFLSDEQKYLSLERIRLNNTGTQNTGRSSAIPTEGGEADGVQSSSGPKSGSA